MSNSVLLSFDVGIKNLAYCAIDASTQAILHWDVLHLQPQPRSDETIQGYCAAMVHALRALPFITTPSHVLIEQQTNNNIRMKVLSHCIQTFFLAHSDPPPRIKFCATAMKGLQAWGSKDRRRIKQEAVERARAHLQTIPQGEIWAHFFHHHPGKKDDLADCLLQAVGYIKTQPPNVTVVI